MAIDARLLVLDEPTLGLDILYRKQFYDSLLNDYFDRSRTIVVTTHQVEEIQHVLTDLMFIDRGRIVFACSMEDFESRYAGSDRESRPARRCAGAQADARAAGARPQHPAVRRVDRQQLAALGEVRTPGIADLFVAVISNQGGAAAANVQRHMKERPDDYSIERRDRMLSSRNQPAPAVSRPPGLCTGRCVASCWSTVRSISRRWRSAESFCSASSSCSSGSRALCREHGNGADGSAPRARAAVRLRRRPDHGGGVHHQHLLLLSTLCTASAAIAASCSGSRCRFPISRPCWRRRAFRCWCCRVIAFAAAVVVETIMLLLSSAVVAGSGFSVASSGTASSSTAPCGDWRYHLVTVHMLWYAPLYCWLLLISAWSRRTPFLWAVLPPFARGHLREDCVSYRLLLEFPDLPLQRRPGSDATARTGMCSTRRCT